MILLYLGFPIKWSHHSMMEGKRLEWSMSMLLNILLGTYFTLLQLYEHIEASFYISDSIYGSSFFMATGFHGIIGTTFILIFLLRQLNNFYYCLPLL